MRLAPLKQAFPSATDFEQIAVQRNRNLLFWSVLLAMVCGAGFVGFGNGNPVVPIVLLISIAGLVLLWHRRKAALYIAFVAAFLF